ncbi:MAG: 2-hydroxyacyl-CoA dehydratase subunit D [Candidatus Helarchaeota archaeon]
MNMQREDRESSLIEKCYQESKLPNSWIKDWKEQGKKVLGYFCSYIPDEIAYAAEILPIRVRAEGCTESPMGDAYMSSTACSFTRCCLELANKKMYDYLDGIISYNSCDQVRRLYDNIRYKAPFSYQYFLDIPSNVNDITLKWFKRELQKFRNNLEDIFKVKITNEKLLSAIKTYNKSRVLLKEIYDLRKQEEPLISGTDVMKLLVASFSIPKNELNNLYTEIINNLKNQDGISDYRARIMVVGSLLDDPNYIKLIEDQGGLVVTDSLCFGSRYFWDLVDENLEPIDALSNRYLSKVSCPRMTDGHLERINFIKKLIKEFYVDGVILQRMKFCPFWWGEIFMLRRELKELGIPYLDLEREYILSGTGATKTRVQAFIEMLEEE